MSRKLKRSTAGLALGLLGGILLSLVGIGDLAIGLWFLSVGIASFGANLAHGLEDAERVKKG